MCHRNARHSGTAARHICHRHSISAGRQVCQVIARKVTWRPCIGVVAAAARYGYADRAVVTTEAVHICHRRRNGQTDSTARYSDRRGSRTTVGVCYRWHVRSSGQARRRWRCSAVRPSVGVTRCTTRGCYGSSASWAVAASSVEHRARCHQLGGFGNGHCCSCGTTDAVYHDRVSTSRQTLDHERCAIGRLRYATIDRVVINQATVRYRNGYGTVYAAETSDRERRCCNRHGRRSTYECRRYRCTTGRNICYRHRIRAGCQVRQVGRRSAGVPSVVIVAAATGHRKADGAVAVAACSTCHGWRQYQRYLAGRNRHRGRRRTAVGVRCRHRVSARCQVGNGSSVEAIRPSERVRRRTARGYRRGRTCRLGATGGAVHRNGGVQLRRLAYRSRSYCGTSAGQFRDRHRVGTGRHVVDVLASLGIAPKVAVCAAAARYREVNGTGAAAEASHVRHYRSGDQIDLGVLHRACGDFGTTVQVGHRNRVSTGGQVGDCGCGATVRPSKGVSLRTARCHCGQRSGAAAATCRAIVRYRHGKGSGFCNRSTCDRRTTGRNIRHRYRVSTRSEVIRILNRNVARYPQVCIIAAAARNSEVDRAVVRTEARNVRHRRRQRQGRRILLYCRRSRCGTAVGVRHRQDIDPCGEVVDVLRGSAVGPSELVRRYAATNRSDDNPRIHGTTGCCCCLGRGHQLRRLVDRCRCNGRTTCRNIRYRHRISARRQACRVVAAKAGRRPRIGVVAATACHRRGAGAHCLLVPHARGA